MATVLDLIKSQLRLLNILALNETPTAQMSSDAIQAINWLLGEWNNDESIVHLTERQSFSCVASTASYTIGSGADWDGNRPLRINNAYITENNSSYPMDEINENEYDDIANKTSEGRPRMYFYNQSFSTGKVYLYPVPSSAYGITIVSKKAFTEYSDTTDTISLPAGYLSALKYNGALELQAEYQEDIKMNPWLIKRAEESLNRIKRTNKKKKPTKKYDPILTGKKTFNVYTWNN